MYRNPMPEMHVSKSAIVHLPAATDSGRMNQRSQTIKGKDTKQNPSLPQL